MNNILYNIIIHVSSILLLSGHYKHYFNIILVYLIAIIPLLPYYNHNIFPLVCSLRLVSYNFNIL